MKLLQSTIQRNKHLRTSLRVKVTMSRTVTVELVSLSEVCFLLAPDELVSSEPKVHS